MKIPAICEMGGNVTVQQKEWSPVDGEYRSISDGGQGKQLRKGICRSKNCDYLGRCTLKVLFELRQNDDSVIYESRWKKREIPELK